jgi:hypothetical protein
MFLGVGYDTDISIMVDGPLWFLVGLFFVKIFHSIIIKFCKLNTWHYLLCTYIMIAWVYLIKKMEIDFYFSIDSAMLAFPFFAVGNILGKRGIFKNTTIAKRQLVVFFLLGIFSLCLLINAVPINGHVDVNGTLFGENIAVFYCIALIGIFATIFLSFLYVKDYKIINILSKGAIVVMAFHGIPAGIIFRLIGLRGEDVVINPIIGMLVSTITLLLFIVPIIVIQKYVPVIMGGRK